MNKKQKSAKKKLELNIETFSKKRSVALKKVIRKELAQIDPEDHYHILAITPQFASDYTSLEAGQAGAEYGAGCGRDCSSGCKWYLELAGAVGKDFGVCTSPDSHRCGLLTFEHQGCVAFEPMSVIDKKYDQAAALFNQNESISASELAKKLKITLARGKKIMRGIKRHRIGFHS